MASRRVPVILSIIVAPLVLFGTACSSGSDNADPQPDKKASASPFKPEDLAVVNNVDPCTLAANVIRDIRLHGKSVDQAHLLSPVEVGAIELNGERRCEYDHGLLTLSTYVEKEGSNTLYTVLRNQRQGDGSYHPFTGGLKRHAQGGWFTYRGSEVGFIEKDKFTGVIIVARTTANSGYTRPQLTTIATQSLDFLSSDFSTTAPADPSMYPGDSGLQDTRWGTINVKPWSPTPSPTATFTGSASTPSASASSPSASATQ